VTSRTNLCILHILQFLNKLAATSHENVVRKMHMYKVFCVLCAAKLDNKASRINVRGRSSFPIETELRKLPLKLAIDDNARLCLGVWKTRIANSEQ